MRSIVERSPAERGTAFHHGAANYLPKTNLERRFANRSEAGRLLARRLEQMRLPGPVNVIALPRGGIPVAAEIASKLIAPLDLMFVRKIVAPWQPKLSVAALVDGNPPQLVVNDELSAYSGVDSAYIESHTRAALNEIARLRQVFGRAGRHLRVDELTAVVVDDGIVTGTTMRAALRELRKRCPDRLVLAVPVAPAEVLESLRSQVDDIVCLHSISEFRFISDHYRDFGMVDDDQAIAVIDAVDDQRYALDQSAGA